MVKSVVTILVLASLCLSQAPAAEPEKAREPEAASLVEEFEAPEFLWLQLEAAQKLVKLGDAGVIPNIRKYLVSRDRRARCNAGLVLAGLGDETGLAAIIAELKDKSPRPPRPRTLPISESRQTAQDRYYAVHVLGVLGDKRAVPVLLDHLEDEVVNFKVAIVLGELGDKRAIPLLKKMLKHKNPDRRLWAGYGLARLGDPAGIPTVAGFLKDPQWVQRRHAARALGSFGDAKAVPALIEALADESPDVRVVVIRALGKLGDARALPCLEKLVDDRAESTSGRVGIVGEVAREAIGLIQPEEQNAKQDVP